MSAQPSPQHPPTTPHHPKPVDNSDEPRPAARSGPQFTTSTDNPPPPRSVTPRAHRVTAHFSPTGADRWSRPPCPARPGPPRPPTDDRRPTDRRPTTDDRRPTTDDRRRQYRTSQPARAGDPPEGTARKQSSRQTDPTRRHSQPPHGPPGDRRSATAASSAGCPGWVGRTPAASRRSPPAGPPTCLCTRHEGSDHSPCRSPRYTPRCRTT